MNHFRGYVSSIVYEFIEGGPSARENAEAVRIGPMALGGGNHLVGHGDGRCLCTDLQNT